MTLEILSAIQRCLQIVYEHQVPRCKEERAGLSREKVTHDVALMDPGLQLQGMSQVGPLNPLITQSLVPSGPLKGSPLWVEAMPGEGHSQEAIRVYCLRCPGMDILLKTIREDQSFHHGSILIKSCPLSPVDLGRI